MILSISAVRRDKKPGENLWSRSPDISSISAVRRDKKPGENLRKLALGHIGHGRLT